LTFWLLGWIISSVCFAGPIAVQLNVDQTSISEEESLTVEVTVNGARSSERPSFPASDDFDLSYRGSSSQVQIINGSMNTAVTHSFAVTPKKSGALTLGPALVTIDGKEYRSEPVTIQVLAQDQKKPDQVYYRLEAVVDNKKPYVNEQITYTFRFLTRVQTTQPEVKWPKFDGFVKEQLGKQRNYQVNEGGLTWNVIEIKEALFAGSPGKKTIDGVLMNLGVVVRGGRGSAFDDDGFFGGFGGFSQTREVTLKTLPIELDVMPLPDAGRPADFSGLVGGYTMKTGLSKSSVKAGESLTLSVVVSGTGNIRMATLAHDNWPHVKVYEDNPVTNVTQQADKLGGTKEFKLAVVPLKQGPLELSGVTLNFYDPKTASYKQIQSDPIKIMVEAGDEEKLAHVAAALPDKGDHKKEIKIVGSDLMPPKEHLDLDDKPVSDLEKSLFTAWVIFCPAFHFGAWGVRRRILRYKADPFHQRRERARRLFRQRLMQLGEGREFYQNLSGAFRNYLGDKFDFDGGALTSVDTARRLSPFDIRKSTIERINEFLSRCDLASYGGAASQLNKEQLVAEARELVTLVDKEAKR
jgi:hypothetical protein